jgi:hypothetical protein
MSSHPINLGLRFFLETAALIALGRWGWRQGDGVLRYVLALGVPLIATVMWATFAVPNDGSRSGRAPVPTPGWLRLLLELSFFTAATWALFASGFATWGWVFGVIAFLHYLVSFDRVLWLLRQRTPFGEGAER